MSGPDFLGIGVSRAGTTYLYQRLRDHPEVWLPPIKELHFFDREVYGWPARDVRRLDFRIRLFLATLRRRHGTWKSRADMHFARSYLRGGLDSLASYRRHFPQLGEGIVKGEITPDYCELDAARIAAIKRALPEAKLLLTLRHPVQRFESQVYKYLEQAGSASAVSSAKHWLESPAFVKSFDYAGIITRWSKIFGRDRLHVAYFDQLERVPEKYMEGICRFLGVGIPCSYEGLSTRPVNSSRRRSCDALSESLVREFARKVLPLFVLLACQEHETPHDWCRDLESLVARG